MIMTKDFYTIPKGIVHELIKNSNVRSSVLLPYDPLGILKDHLEQEGITVERNEEEENILDPQWWAGHRHEHDWVVASTMGLSQYSELITEYGRQVATKGLAILDRLSFIEPVTKRRDFLLTYKLSNMIVLNPRPRFRAIGSTKDSVTSCWFVFQRADLWHDATQITFGLDWDRVAPLPSLPQ